MFDSGAGGLAVLRELRRLLPGEDVIYYADTAYFPYGPKSSTEIQERAESITDELL
jgi:glutamate racemase